MTADESEMQGTPVLAGRLVDEHGNVHSPLISLPAAVLGEILHWVKASTSAGSAAAIRATCRGLCDAFDCSNTRLVLGGATHKALHAAQCHTISALLLALVQRTPCLDTLVVRPRLEELSLADILQAAKPEQLVHIDVGPTPGYAGFYNIIKTKLSNLECLSACTALHFLDLQYSEVSDLAPLAACQSLQHLCLSKCGKLSDLAPLAACKSLQHLDLSWCGNLSGLAPLAACKSLQHLVLSWCGQLSDLAPLAACKLLQHLDLDGCHKVSDLAPLATCKSLLYLNLSKCQLLSDLAPLAACKMLQHLDLAWCTEVSDLAPLAACRSLKFLDLRWCYNVSNMHLANLASLEACESLQLMAP